MNPLAKALLAKEIQTLISQLKQGHLSYFETARCKKRLEDIVTLCDQPDINQQIFGGKSHIQPIADAEIFAKNCHYSSSFCGIFRRDEKLEQQLSSQKKSSWALLFHINLGWQIWIMQQPSCILLISDWGTLNEVYAWLIEEQHDEPVLTPDEGISLPNKPKKRFIQPSATPSIHLPKRSNLAQTASPQPVMLEALQDELPVELPTLCLDQVTFELIELPDLAENKLFRLQPQQGTALGFIDILAYNIDFEEVLERTLYLAEQIDAQGYFVRYLALFGAQNELQAIRMLNKFSQHQNYKLAAIRTLSWGNLTGNLLELESFFEVYSEQAQLVFESQDYYPFIPKELINTQKFIKFEETSADLNTPILVLKERNKIRIIHGKNRLALSKQEHAFPYLMLDRQAGISWQYIQEKLALLPHPVQALQLYQALQQHSWSGTSAT